MQSWEWGEFQKSIGNKIFRLWIEDDGELMSAITLIKKKLLCGKSYLYWPQFNYQLPITNYQLNSKFKDQKFEIIDLLFNEIQKIAKNENAIFLRFEPQFGFQSKIENRLPAETFVQEGKSSIVKTFDVQPSKTLILNLDKSEEDMLKAMRQKTRYNIRLSEKKGVKIREANVNEFDKFWELIKKTSKRDGFRLHDKMYYQKMLEPAMVKLFLAEYKNNTVAANIMVFFGDTVTYLHGASSTEHRNIMAPYILQWHCIKLAKKLGYRYYDFYGIDDKKWPGVTRFKNGFNGDKIEHPGTFDLIFNKKLYLVYEIMRKLKRFFH
ncbi:peptidoglycan bridge formation glycyltransferase FemA/FemB family protein [Patescibacteria group bacterium]|nr:peptidoglycan bridge formation glycyltransferase FemA/FemB family protein [Patescibacteria group bacterium]